MSLWVCSSGPPHLCLSLPHSLYLAGSFFVYLQENLLCTLEPILCVPGSDSPASPVPLILLQGMPLS